MYFNHVDNIKQICRAKGIQMKDLAEKLGINPITLSRNISGNPTLGTIEKLATALDVEPSEILFGIKDNQQEKHVCPHCNMEIKVKVELTK